MLYVEGVSVLSDLLRVGMCAGASGEPERDVLAIIIIKTCSHTSLLLCVVAKSIEMKKRMRNVMK